MEGDRGLERSSNETVIVGIRRQTINSVALQSDRSTVTLHLTACLPRRGCAFVSRGYHTTAMRVQVVENTRDLDDSFDRLLVHVTRDIRLTCITFAGESCDL